MRAIKNVLIVNRGEIAVRCIRACKKLSITSVALYTAADASSLHVSLADRAVMLDDEGPKAYTDIDTILGICKKETIHAVFPGYGFLSENTEFARRVEEIGVVFVGPHASSVECMGLKHLARELAIKANVPVVKGSGLLYSPAEAVEAAKAVGFPVMLKASGGGGGMGTQICWAESEVETGFIFVRGRAEALFKDSGVFLERYYPACHHIEVQVFGNGSEVIHFGERECSIQRRLQKVVEESPSPFLSDKPDLRDRLLNCALSLTKSINYRSAGTVEFLVDDESDDFFFLEMNTRLQVEHGISELCYDVDIVALMLQQADYQLADMGGIPSEELLKLQKHDPNGAAIEVRLCCENPATDFLPTTGFVQELVWPKSEEVRVDTWIQTGISISSYFDSLIGKIMVHQPTRAEAMSSMERALKQTKVNGLVTNLSLLVSIITSDVFAKGRTLTTFLEKQFNFQPCGFQVLSPGGHTTVQQARDRSIKGYGIPASGPLDDLSATIANILVGNPRDTECLEITRIGPELYFFSDAIISICGAPLPVDIDGTPVEMWTRVHVRAKQTLKAGLAAGRGCCAYIAIKGGLPAVATWLNSKSTTSSLGLGGLQGRALRIGDYVELEQLSPGDIASTLNAPISLPPTLVPSLISSKIHVLHGPHDSDDYITASGCKTLYSTEWKVHYNCSRSGIRLDGPQIEWARSRSGGASHPSNVVDYPYPSPGGVNWTGDNPVLFPRDAPGFGGFICSSTVVEADLWKLGQVKPGDRVRFMPISWRVARMLAERKAKFVDAVEEFVTSGVVSPDVNLNVDDKEKEDPPDEAILKVIKGGSEVTTLTVRQAGDTSMLVDLGFQKASLETAVHANLLAEAVRVKATPDIIVHVNISAIMLTFNPTVHNQQSILTLLTQAHATLIQNLTPLPSPGSRQRKQRHIHLPLCLSHPSLTALQSYYESHTRHPTIQHSPNPLDYVASANALPSTDGIKNLLLNTPFYIPAVGFLTGLPLLLPASPMARLHALKFNPPRTSTPPGTVALGNEGIFCIYPADLPGGYVPLARTVPVWDTWSLKRGFQAGRPWLCEVGDWVRFYEVSVDEYEGILREWERGSWRPKIVEDEDEGDVGDEEKGGYELQKMVQKEKAMLSSPEYQTWKAAQETAARTALEKEQAMFLEWKTKVDSDAAATDPSTISISNSTPDGIQITSPHQGKIWKYTVQPGDKIAAGQTVAILESMKMEIPIVAGGEHEGLVVVGVVGGEGALVVPGQGVVVVV